MDYKEWQSFEKELLDRGYKKWTSALYGEEDFDVSKKFIVDDNQDDPKEYVIIFRFWDFEKYRINVGYSVSVAIMPHFDGRADMLISTDVTNIKRIEEIAEHYYQLVVKEFNLE